MGLGVIARDHEGRVLAMQCSTRRHIDTPTKAEMLAVWNAVILGVQLGVTYLELEGDAMEVVQGINSMRHCLGRERPILNDIKALLQNFNTWKVTHVNMGSNGAAHSLVRLALFVGGGSCLVWEFSFVCVGNCKCGTSPSFELIKIWFNVDHPFLPH